MYKEEKMREYLKKDRYGIKDLASWLGLKYNSANLKVKGKNAWSLTDILKIQDKLGKKAVDDIFLN